MAQTTAEFFDQLAERGHEPLLEKATGTVRFELVNGNGRTERWLVAIKKGDVDRVARERRRPTASSARTGRSSRQIVTGEANAIAACCAGLSTSRATPSCSCSSSALFPGPPQREAAA